MIKNVVFDVGQVLLTFDPPKALGEMGYDETTIKVLMETMFNNPLWSMLDRSIYSRDEMEEKFVSIAPDYEKEIRTVFRSVKDFLQTQPYAEEWMIELKKQGYHLYIISNYPDFLYEETKQKMIFLPYMDGVVFSYMYQVIKPEKEIYETLLNTYNLKAEECVFIDDHAKNVEGAKRVGFTGIHFKSYAQAKEALNQCLASVSE